MSIDEYMISYCRKNKGPVLRIYNFRPAAISIGKYQDAVADINIENCADDEVCVVRRMTGGGAIFHESELTYSLACSEEDIGGENLSVKETFEKLNSFLTGMYASFGLKASYAKDSIKYRKIGGASSFCFSDNEEYDIIIRKKKIGGNAQARKKNIIFQHGSIPFEIDQAKIKRYFNKRINFNNCTCMKGLMKKRFSPLSVEKAFISSFKKTFRVKLREEPINGQEREKVDRFMMEKYNSDEWNLKGETAGIAARDMLRV